MACAVRGDRRRLAVCSSESQDGAFFSFLHEIESLVELVLNVLPEGLCEVDTAGTDATLSLDRVFPAPLLWSWLVTVDHEAQ